MFIGHFGVGLAGKAAVKQVSLGTLFLAAQWIDLIWPVLLLFGFERVQIDPGNTAFTPLDFVYYPFTHSLVGVLIWAVLFAVVYHVINRNVKVSLLLGGLVISHWLLDLVVHRPDLPLTLSNEHMVGFGLWNNVSITILVEGLIFIVGALVYLSVTRAKDRLGKFGTIGLLVFLMVIYIMNIVSPPPDNTTAIAIVGNAQWLIIIWAYWIDRHRVRGA